MKYIRFICQTNSTKNELIPIDGPMTTPLINGTYFLYIGNTPYMRFDDATAVAAFWQDFSRQMWADGNSIYNLVSTRWKGANNGVCNF